MYKFKNSNLDLAWRIHPSYKKSVTFQRLEFFGDKILSFILTSFLMKNKKSNEGELSIQLSTLINKQTVAKVGEFLSPLIICSGKLTISMLCDIVEAYIACVYLDGGDVFELIEYMWKDVIKQSYQASYKNQVQEFLQARKLNIDYKYNKIDNKFICIATLIENSIYSCSAIGVSKKEASTLAAKLFLNKWQKELN